MGEYYDWVNVDRREYISPCDFGLGNKRTESNERESTLILALKELLYKEWSGDHILWMGDEKQIEPNTTNITLQTLYMQSLKAGYPGDSFDTVNEYYRNISGLFKNAEDEVRSEIDYFLSSLNDNSFDVINYYGIDIDKPFDGLFKRNGRSFKYTINYTKKICYSSEETIIMDQNDMINDSADPLPFLMSYGRTSNTGDWVGDVVGVSDELPENCKILEEIHLI